VLERDAENSYLAGDDLEAGPLVQRLGSSITYRIAVGPQAGRKTFTLQTLPARDEPFDEGVGEVAGFSLHAGVAARADQGEKLERLAGTSVGRRSRGRLSPALKTRRSCPKHFVGQALEKILAHFQGKDTSVATSLRPESRAPPTDLFG
jgi:hypothetical protein